MDEREADERSTDLCRGAYPPDGVPFADVERLAEQYAESLGCRVPAMSAVHLVAWCVTLGVCTEEEAAEAVAGATQRSLDPAVRLIELRRLILAAFTRNPGQLRILVFKAKPQDQPPAASLSDKERLLAQQIAEALGDRQPPCAWELGAAQAVMAGRLLEGDLWAMVSMARIFVAEAHRVFHCLLDWYSAGVKAGRKLPALQQVHAAPAGPMIPIAALIPSPN